MFMKNAFLISLLGMTTVLSALPAHALQTGLNPQIIGPSGIVSEPDSGSQINPFKFVSDISQSVQHFFAGSNPRTSSATISTESESSKSKAQWEQWCDLPEGDTAHQIQELSDCYRKVNPDFNRQNYEQVMARHHQVVQNYSKTDNMTQTAHVDADNNSHTASQRIYEPIPPQRMDLMSVTTALQHSHD